MTWAVEPAVICMDCSLAQGTPVVVEQNEEALNAHVNHYHVTMNKLVQQDEPPVDA